MFGPCFVNAVLSVVSRFAFVSLGCFTFIVFMMASDC